MHSHTTELLPCPFCHYVPGAPLLFAKINASESLVCGHCGAYGPAADTEAEAIAAWNRRSYATALGQQAPATKDEALRAARAALAEIEWSNDSEWQSDRARSALRTIALAVEGPSVRMLSPAEHFAIGLREPVRIADIEAVQRKFCEVNGLRLAGSPAVQSVALGDPKAAFEAAMREKHPEWSFTPDPVFGYHNERTRCAWEGWQVAASASGAVGETAPTTYAPSREVVQQALELVDRIRDSHESWGGWSGIPQTCERITNMLRYGAAAGLPGTSNGQEN